MNSFHLKLIAAITMLIDHTGVVFFPQYGILRQIGRISFPIYCFLISEGVKHTHDIYKYFFRLSLFAIISEIPFNLAFDHSVITADSRNVFVTLAMGVLAIICIEKIKNKILSAFLILFLLYFSTVVNCDYDWYGILMILGFYFSKGSAWKTATVQAGATQLYCFAQMFKYGVNMFRLNQQASMVSIPLLILYNGEKGYSNRVIQWAFYFFYPAHLILLWGLNRFV